MSLAETLTFQAAGGSDIVFTKKFGDEKQTKYGYKNDGTSSTYEFVYKSQKAKYLGYPGDRHYLEFLLNRPVPNTPSTIGMRFYSVIQIPDSSLITLTDKQDIANFWRTLLTNAANNGLDTALFSQILNHEH